MNARRFPVPAAWHLLLAAICGVYFVGAFRAVPFTRTADRDFDLVRSWRVTGRLTTHPSDPSHLTKPGAIALLRMMFPRDSPVAARARRFVVLAVAALERNEKVRAVLVASGLPSDRIDGVPNAARAPKVAKFLELNFQPFLKQDGVEWWLRRSRP